MPGWNSNEYDSMDKLFESIKWYYESNRSDKDAQFIILHNEEAIGIVNKETHD